MIQSEENSAHHITWIENLSRGAVALLIHPFLPLKDYGFNYSCLYSKQPCCLVRMSRNSMSAHQTSVKSFSKDYPAYIQIPKSILGTIFSHLIQITPTNKVWNDSVGNSESSLSYAYMRLKDYAVKNKPKSSLIAGQLVLCNCLLTCYLIEDIRYIYHYILNYRNYSRSP